MNTPVTIDWIVSNVDELLEANLEYTEDTKALRLFIRGKLTESLKHGIAQEPNIQQLIGEIDDLGYRQIVYAHQLNPILDKWRTK